MRLGRKPMLKKVLNFPDFFRSSRPYRRSYGFANGLRIALQVRRAKYAASPGSLVSVHVPGLGSPVFLRAHTSDALVFRQIFAHRPFDINLSTPPVFIVDAGAHIGLSSIWLCERFPSARIVALEVEEANFRLLTRNTVSHPRIVPLHKGLWSKKTELEIEDPSVATWAFSVREAPSGNPDSVPGVGLMDILREYDQDTIDLLKLDIEGAELEVFSHGYEPWIDRVRVIVLELHDRFKPGCNEAVQRALAGRGFTETKRGEYRIFFHN